MSKLRHNDTISKRMHINNDSENISSVVQFSISFRLEILKQKRKLKSWTDSGIHDVVPFTLVMVWWHAVRWVVLNKITCSSVRTISILYALPLKPLAAEAGLTILKQGGNAADAAVAVAAALNVTQPTSTGNLIFFLYFL